ncbi:MAG TPA: nuclear transport factor 2 family protein [Longimicrobiales bacterium]|nr:nuclear transport factor 2 family protein [Longimicrobiales bacterium]
MRPRPRARLAALALALPLAACAAEAPVDGDPADAAAAEAVVGDFFRAMESWDYDALRGTVTPDFELVEDTVIMSMDDFVAFIEPFEAQGAQMRWTLTDHNTEADGDVAWTRYINRAVLEMGGEESRFHWIESAVLQRQPDGAWKIDRLQSTPVSVEGPAAGAEPAH